MSTVLPAEDTIANLQARLLAVRSALLLAAQNNGATFVTIDGRSHKVDTTWLVGEEARLMARVASHPDNTSRRQRLRRFVPVDRR